MTIFNRLKYALFMSVAIIGLGMVIDMIFKLDLGDKLFSDIFIYPLLLVTFCISPIIEKYIKFK
jgi:hypothetical protein